MACPRGADETLNNNAITSPNLHNASDVYPNSQHYPEACVQITEKNRAPGRTQGKVFCNQYAAGCRSARPACRYAYMQCNRLFDRARPARTPQIGSAISLVTTHHRNPARQYTLLAR